MMSAISSALIITGIGMGLVFIAILALWGMMEIMVRATTRLALKEAEEAQESEEESEVEEEAETIQPAVDSSAELKRKAAAAAVALALADAQVAGQPVYSQVSSYMSGSAWQAVSRGGQLHQSAVLYNRKSRGK